MIRDARAEDVPVILEIYRPYILNTAISFEYDVPSAAAFTDRFLEITAHYPWLVWEEDGQILGFAHAGGFLPRDAYRWNAALSIYLRQDCRGKGIGRQLYTALEDRLRDLGYFVVYGIVTSINEVSCRFHEAMGYRPVGTFPRSGFKFGRWYDIIWYEKRLREGLPETLPRSNNVLGG